MRAETGLRWIAFDAVGTLITADPPAADVYHRIGSRHGSQLRLEEVGCRFAESSGRRTSDDNLSSSESIEHDFWRAVVGDVLTDVRDAEACSAELHAWFAQPSAWRCFEDVEPALTTLAERGYRLAIASNFDGRLHPVCKGLPPLESVATRVVSSEMGWRKPHAGFFQGLSSACGCRPGQILMVGDDIRNDVRAAEEAGLKAVWLDRHRTIDAARDSTPIIQSLVELAALVPVAIDTSE
ncbi:MAG: HAD family hydrolase [Planctomycetaceae bacterium]